ncbi:MULTISPECIES: hypothetical protein [Prochlorococcus]|uniref:hypothetical protein n=1 Tax=Prochlorococcus TaxID=1218 RepID=UPI0007B3405A|nr:MULTISPECIES: hypothetical protein [Prochlorococcus]KZR66176.1 hypothetical protein PMIT1312_01005 [Prochlorococcus marinus str. MIT 1312]KZR83008.1 hypothetical protein PMIT1327_00665 [Prochlorococcus marinus str. MIT 1327]NMP05482.1 hypothetical protein [Prochlorococcus sp. P1361]NMP13060.1 hypothetical protein [Prochlorococcus sp.P1363]
MSSPFRLRVVIPHFFRDGASDSSGGYGSGRHGNRLPRSLALARCLGNVLSLNRAPQDWILNIAERKMEMTPVSNLRGLPGVVIDLHLFVCGDDWLQDVVELFAPRLQLHRMELSDPRQLPLEAVRQLLDMSDPGYLSLYLEDDLVIQDQNYVDKLEWFYQRTENRFVLMPHRREPTVANAPQQLYVDGPIKDESQIEPLWASDEAVVGSGHFWDGQEVEFVKPFNPHSGSFCISADQASILRSAPWPPPTFVGPLETAATGTVLMKFPVLKPAWRHRNFLTLEHGNPSFLSCFNQFPRRDCL